MEIKEGSWHLKDVDCPLCHSSQAQLLGVRGNREHFGANPHAEPHIRTNVVKCSSCGFIFTNPMIVGLEHLEEEHYNNPDNYQQDESGSVAAMFERRLHYISGFKKSGSLLDVGAGKGEFLAIAKKHGWSVHGVEPSPEFCKYAKEHYGIDILQGFLSKDSFSPASFDLVSLHHVLEHVDDPEALLQLIRSYLKKDGLLFIEVPNANATLHYLVDFYFKIKGLGWSSRLSPLHPPFHKYGYSEKPLRHLLNKCGFETVAVKTFPEADRENSGKKRGFSYTLKKALSSGVDLLGNRELITIIAKPAATKAGL